ncbi:MAG: hypothetical protein HY911_06175 [Desulfobacterales bacterium]|nr:hypothetical protein [Desulfobacterales bacterium]
MRICHLICAWLLLAARIGFAQPAEQLVEVFPSGAINWSKGYLVAKGTFLPEHATSPKGLNPEQSIAQAQRQALLNALRTLREVRLDAGLRVAELMAADERINARAQEMAGAARVIEVQPLADGAVRVAVQMELRGGFAQLVLPAEIKQVESIRQMAPAAEKPSKAQAPPQPMAPAPLEGQSGLIVDARGIGAKPAMVPLLLDENGKQVYGPAFISREYAVQHGVCEYDRSVDKPAQRERVAPNPLIIKGLRTLHDQSCDIVISNADADRLRDASANLGFLKQCRVIIVLD